MDETKKPRIRTVYFYVKDKKYGPYLIVDVVTGHGATRKRTTKYLGKAPFVNPAPEEKKEKGD